MTPDRSGFRRRTATRPKRRNKPGAGRPALLRDRRAGTRAGRLSVLLSGPYRNEVIPLVEMLTDGRFKSTHDFLREFVARFARPQGRAVAGNFRQNVRGITPVRARQIDGQ